MICKFFPDSVIAWIDVAEPFEMLHLGVSSEFICSTHLVFQMHVFFNSVLKSLTKTPFLQPVQSHQKACKICLHQCFL